MNKNQNNAPQASVRIRNWEMNFNFSNLKKNRIEMKVGMFLEEASLRNIFNRNQLEIVRG